MIDPSHRDPTSMRVPSRERRLPRIENVELSSFHTIPGINRLGVRNGKQLPMPTSSAFQDAANSTLPLSASFEGLKRRDVRTTTSPTQLQQFEIDPYGVEELIKLAFDGMIPKANLNKLLEALDSGLLPSRPCRDVMELAEEFDSDQPKILQWYATATNLPTELWKHEIGGQLRTTFLIALFLGCSFAWKRIADGISLGPWIPTDFILSVPPNKNKKWQCVHLTDLVFMIVAKRLLAKGFSTQEIDSVWEKFLARCIVPKNFYVDPKVLKELPGWMSP